MEGHPCSGTAGPHLGQLHRQKPSSLTRAGRQPCERLPFRRNEQKQLSRPALEASLRALLPTTRLDGGTGLNLRVVIMEERSESMRRGNRTDVESKCVDYRFFEECGLGSRDYECPRQGGHGCLKGFPPFHP